MVKVKSMNTTCKQLLFILCGLGAFFFAYATDENDVYFSGSGLSKVSFSVSHYSSGDQGSWGGISSIGGNGLRVVNDRNGSTKVVSESKKWGIDFTKNSNYGEPVEKTEEYDDAKLNFALLGTLKVTVKGKTYDFHGMYLAQGPQHNGIVNNNIWWIAGKSCTHESSNGISCQGENGATLTMSTDGGSDYKFKNVKVTGGIGYKQAYFNNNFVPIGLGEISVTACNGTSSHVLDKNGDYKWTNPCTGTKNTILITFSGHSGRCVLTTTDQADIDMNNLSQACGGTSSGISVKTSGNNILFICTQDALGQSSCPWLEKSTDSVSSYLQNFYA